MEHMPVVLGIGIAPMLQWIVIPPVVLWLAARHLGFRIRDVPKATGILPDR
jgi:hypothetical protein